MADTDFLTKLMDPYDWRARLYPCVLALIPPISIWIFIYTVNIQVLNNVIGIIIACSLLYFLAYFSREKGKCLEPRLFTRWGGVPTTQLLRHCNQIIDPITKNRYHVFLSERINMQFPSYDEETHDSTKADDIYSSSVRWLIANTRDTKKFHLLFQENIKYGVRRNCLGLKSFAIIIASCSIIWIFVSQHIITTQGFYKNNIFALSHGVRISLLVSSIMLIVWIFFVTRKTVKSAAFAYAERLLSACDTLDEKHL